MRSFFLILLFFTGSLSAQRSLSLDEANELAAKNYPVTRQRDLVRETARLTLENLGKGYLPQVSLSGQASYQSDVTSIPVKLPNLNIETPSKDQYRVLADVSQLVYDGGAIQQQKRVQNLNAAVENEKIAVELQKVREKINELYLGVLLTDEQLKLLSIADTDLNAGIRRVNDQVQNGTALRSNLANLQAELLRNNQKRTELSSTRESLVNVISLFINEPLPHDVKLEAPVLLPLPSQENTRSELHLFHLQDSLLSTQAKGIDIKNKPKVSLFAQWGYGRPALNLLQNNFQLYGIGGVRLNWNLANLYTRKNEKELAGISRRNIDTQRDVFLLNTNAALIKETASISQLEELIKVDEQIIALREQVAAAAKAQLENGILLAGDYIREIDAADAARQNLALHRLQLLQSQLNYRTVLGK